MLVGGRSVSAAFGAALLATREGARSFVETLLAAVLPPRCALCNEPLAVRPRYRVCARCLEHVAHNEEPRCELCDEPGAVGTCARCTELEVPVRVVAPYLYGGSIAEAITAAKFRRREDVAAGLGLLLADEPRVRAAVEGATALVPVALGRRRARERGYNQSAVLARVLGRELGVPVVHALTRARETRPQSELPLEARRANVAGAFRGLRPVSGACVLVDDVVTSGETATQAATALRACGAERVVVVAVARTPR